MKITADFYTPDEAAYAAGIIKANVPGALDVKITGEPRRSISRSTFAAPLTPDEVREDFEKRGSYRTGVICRAEDASYISGILVNKGGHNITRKA